MVLREGRVELSTSETVFALVVLSGSAYLFVSWAIDSGSLVAYFLAFLSAYYAVYFLLRLIKRNYFTYDKANRARAVKKAH